MNVPATPHAWLRPGDAAHPISVRGAALPHQDPVATETHALVLQTHDLSSQTHLLALATFAAVAAPLVLAIAARLARILHQRSEKRRAHEVIETFALLLAGELKPIAVNPRSARGGVFASGVQYLVERMLDPELTRYLSRGNFDLAHISASKTYGVLAIARDRLGDVARMEDRAGKSVASGQTMSVFVDSRDFLDAMQTEAKAVLVLLRLLRRRVHQRDSSDYIDYEREDSQLAIAIGI